MLEQHYQATGRAPVGLIGPELPDELGYVWRWFVELDEARAVSAMGAAPITFESIQAWAQLTGRAPLPFEVRLLRRIDRLRLQRI